MATITDPTIVSANPDDGTTTITPGVKTSEFWLALAVLVAATVLAVLDVIDGQAWLAAAGVTGAGYSLSRGLAKR